MSLRIQLFHGHMISVMVWQEVWGLEGSNHSDRSLAYTFPCFPQKVGLMILKIESTLGDKLNLSQRQWQKKNMPWVGVHICGICDGTAGLQYFSVRRDIFVKEKCIPTYVMSFEQV